MQFTIDDLIRIIGLIIAASGVITGIVIAVKFWPRNSIH